MKSRESISHPHDDRLMSPAEMAREFGMNVNAVREAMRDGLKHVKIGKGRKPFLRSTPRWWRLYLEGIEHSASVAGRVEEILGSTTRPRVRRGRDA